MFANVVETKRRASRKACRSIRESRKHVEEVEGHKHSTVSLDLLSLEGDAVWFYVP